MTSPARICLTIAGTLSAAAALLHLAIIAGGPDWYRYFGAGEGMARLAESGSPKPVLITLGIAAVLATFSAYAFAGAGRIRRLPLLRTALAAISSIYLLRGLILLPALAMNDGRVEPFLLWSSLVVLLFGLAYGIGTFLAWPSLAVEPS